MKIELKPLIKPLILTTLVVAVPSLVCPEPAHAYLDPGSGSMAFQLIIAGILGAIFSLKMYWRKAKEAFLRFLGRSTDKN